jgi:hypothetical protein
MARWDELFLQPAAPVLLQAYQDAVSAAGLAQPDPPPAVTDVPSGVLGRREGHRYLPESQ